MIKAVIFDMDGVIIDSEGVNLKALWEFAVKKNPNIKIEQLYPMIGNSQKDAWDIMARVVNNGQTWTEIGDEAHQIETTLEIDYRAIYRSELTLLLSQLKELGYLIALASSTKMEVIEKVLAVNQIRDYFQVVVSGASFKRSKPDPEIYHFTAGQLGIKEAECFVVEDSTVGIKAAKRAGMTVAAYVDDRYGLDQSAADYQITAFDQVLDFIK